MRLVKVSVSGVLKLLFKKEMCSSRLISTFLINWAIPLQGKNNLKRSIYNLSENAKNHCYSLAHFYSFLVLLCLQILRSGLKMLAP